MVDGAFLELECDGSSQTLQDHVVADVMIDEIAIVGRNCRCRGNDISGPKNPN